MASLLLAHSSLQHFIATTLYVDMSDAFRRRVLFFIIWTAIVMTQCTLATGFLFPRGQVIGFWYEPKVVLNDGDETLIGSEQAQDDAVALVENLKRQMLEIKSNGIQEDGSAVDYDKIKALPVFGKYLCLVKNLKDIQLNQLSTAQKKSCLINLYNCLLVHAIVNGLLKEEEAGGTFARVKLYATASYNIGGALYSLNDIENGLLRGNRKSAVPLTFPPFRRSNDLRRQIMLECDPRIHFALNCGARSCPPIGVYSSTEVDEQLDRATQGFLDQSVVFDEATQTISLSMLFSWYKRDFGSTDAEVLQWIYGNASKELADKIAAFNKACEPRDPKIKFLPYDWNLNSVI
jgi:hypothetical protein